MLRLQRPWNPSDLTLGGNGCGSLQNMAGAKLSNVFGAFFTTFTHKICVDPVHSKSSFATNLSTNAAKSLDSLGNSAWVAWWGGHQTEL